MWGGGFLGAWGVLDFAGGTVVHINAGVAGLVAALVLGKRRGYRVENLAPHNLVLSVVGASLLWVGWFGFNAGSAVAADGRAGMAMAVTQIATAAAALSWMFSEWMVQSKPSVLGIISGAVAGLVGIVGALLTGVFAVAAFSVSADSPEGSAGLLDGNPRQVLTQLYGIGVTVVYTGVVSLILLKIVDAILGLRVDQETEREGLDLRLHGETVH